MPRRLLPPPPSPMGCDPHPTRLDTDLLRSWSPLPIPSEASTAAVLTWGPRDGRRRRNLTTGWLRPRPATATCTPTPTRTDRAWASKCITKTPTYDDHKARSPTTRSSHGSIKRCGPPLNDGSTIDHRLVWAGRLHTLWAHGRPLDLFLNCLRKTLRYPVPFHISTIAFRLPVGVHRGNAVSTSGLQYSSKIRLTMISYVVFFLAFSRSGASARHTHQ